MLIVILGAATGVFIYRMGVIIGRAQAQEDIEKLRKQMSLDSIDEAWNLLYYGDEK